MKTLNFKVQVSDEEYAIIKAGMKAGETEYSLLLYGLENTFNHYSNLKDNTDDGIPLDPDVVIFFKEFDRIMKTLEKKK